MDEKQLDDYNKKVNINEQLKKQAKSDNSFRSQLLSQDQWKQEILDSLLQIRRQTITMDAATSKPLQNVEESPRGVYLQDFIRLEDGTGRWKTPSELTENQLDEIKKGGIVNEEGAKFIIGHLEALTNNNIALSNLTKDQINDICREAELSLRNSLINNRESFGIDSTDDVREIVSSIVRPNMTANFSKAKNGSFVSEILREIRMVGSMDDEDDDESGLRAAFQ